ncbi:putative endopeptidase [Nocardioides aquaticus]|uniref:Endopeptidase n=1 Tax=Nocardioides aquaticus TaxID=160826 RepID=A0ABX8EJ81_9ACTN|nr:putative endopeptidase [Nocardioides aquaticus]
MQHGRHRFASVLTGLTLVAGVSLVSSSPAAAEPTLDEVKSRVDTLYHEAEIASERYNDARLELDELTDDLDSLSSDQQRQDRRLEAVREQVRDTVLQQMQGDNLSAMGQVVVSDDPQAFVSQMSTMSAFYQLQQGMFTDYATELKALDLRAGATEDRASEVEVVEQRLKAEKDTIDAKVDEAEALLADLEAEERERLAAAQAAEAARSQATVSRSTTPEAEPEAEEEPAASVPASGGAGAAVSYAMSQVGDAYVYGAAGPDAFDCSGLTMMAWGAAGVGLPHSSGAQMSSGPSVSSSDLQPGDLVFYYSPVSHVGMYIGNGQIVHAANPGTGVAIAPVFSMPFSGAVRPG